MSFLELRKEIETEQFKNIMVFHGEERFLIEEAEKILIKKLINNAEKDVNIFTVSDKKFSIEEIFNFCETLSFFSENKLLVLKNTELLSGITKQQENKFVNLISNLPKKFYILFVEENIKTKNKKIIDFIKNEGQTIEFRKYSKKKIDEYITTSLRHYDKNISLENLVYFNKLCDYNLRDCSLQIEKIANYSDNLYITKTDIDEVFVRVSKPKIFDIFEYLISQDKKATLECLKDLKINNYSPLSILKVISSNLKNIIVVKRLIDDNIELSKIRDCLEDNKKFLLDKFLAMSKLTDSEKLNKTFKNTICFETKMMSGKIKFEWLFLKLYIINNFLT